MKKFCKVMLVCLLLLLSGCSGVRRYVAYTVYPVGYLIERIAGGRVETISIQDNALVQTASIVPDYQEILRDSTYLFHIGDLEPYFDLYQSEIAETGVKKIDLSTLNAIYPFERYTMVYVDGKETYVASPYYNGDVFNSIDVNELDLSLWVDPIGMLSMAQDIFRTLSANYVEQAAAFKENFEQLEADLIELDAAYQNLSRSMKSKGQTIKFVAMSPNFGNWQKAYGFGVYPVCLSRYGALPSDRELEIIKKRIVDDGVKFIAYEPNMSEAMLELFDQLSEELDLKRIDLYNLSSLTPSQINESKDYLSLMYANLSALENIAMAPEEMEEIKNDAEEVEKDGQETIVEENVDKNE